MKKKLRARIKALASQIIEHESTFNATEMKATIGKLYDRLIILEYLEAQIEERPEKKEKQSLDSKSFREENWFTEPEPLPQPTHTEDLIEPLVEKIKDIVAQMPQEAERVDEMLKEVLPEKKYIKNDLEEFAKSYQQMPTFERKHSETVEKPVEVVSSPIIDSAKPKADVETLGEQRAKSLNDTAKQGLNIGLNDRLAFIKHLFDGSAEDYARVLSQVNTMDSYDDAITFIKGKVKPDYNFWLNKDMYAERFLALIEKSFD